MAVTRQEYYNQILRRSINQYQELIKKYNDDLNRIITESKADNTPTFLDYASLALVPFVAWKNFKYSFLNVAFGTTDILATAINDLLEAGQALWQGDIAEASSDLLYAVVNPALTLVEGFAASLASGANIVQKGIADIIPDNWYSIPEPLRISQFSQNSYEGFLTDLEYNANALRAGILDWNAEAFKNINNRLQDPEAARARNEANEAIIADEMRQLDLSGILPASVTEQSNIARDYITGNMQQGLDPLSSYQALDTVETFTLEDWLKQTNTFKPLAKEATDIIYGPTIGKLEERWQEVFGEEKWFQTTKGTFESIGDILAMMAVAKLAGLSGMSQAAAARSAQAFFFGNIASRSFEEALNSGTSIQDAFTYSIAVGATETAIENIGGIRFGNALGHIGKQGSKSLLSSVLRNAIEEGGEEVLAEFLQPGYQKYLTGKVEDTNIQDLLIRTNEEGKFVGFGDLIHSFVAGFGASFILGGGQSLVVSRTINQSIDRTIREFDKYAEKYGAEAALEKFKFEIENISEKLNNNPFGQVVDENGNTKLVRMNKEATREFINNTILKLFISENKEGKFILNKDMLEKFTVDGFQVKLQDGTVISRKDYALNSSVFGVDVTDNGKYEPVKVSELSDTGKVVYDITQKLKAPIVIYRGKVQEGVLTEQGELGSNSVLYINENAINPTNVREYVAKLLKHETIHLIKSTDPALFETLEKTVLDNIGLTIDVEGNITLELNNEQLRPILGDLQAELQASFNNTVARVKRQLNLTEEQALPNNMQSQLLDRMNEELVAYVTEKFITDAAFYNFFERVNPTLIQRISRVFGGGTQIAVPSKIKQVNRLLKEYAENWKLAVRFEQQRRQTLNFYIETIFGNEIIAANLFFTQETINKHGVPKLVQALVNSYNKANNSIVIDDEEIQLDTISREGVDWSQLRPQRVEPTDMRQRVQDFEFDKEKTKEYLTALRSYERTLNDVITTSEGEVFQKTRTRLNTIESVMEKINDGQGDTLGNAEKLILFEALDAKKEKVKPTTRTYDRKETMDRIIFNLNSRAIRQFKDLTAFQDWKNRSYTDGAITFTKKLDNIEAANQLLNILEFEIENMQTGKGKRILAGQYDVDYDFNKTTGETVFFVYPKDSVVQQLVKEREAKLLEEQDTQEEQELSPAERKKLQKFYSNETLAKSVFNNVVAVLDAQGINITDLTIIESSAGDGAFIKVFKDYDENIKVEAYDLAPEAEGIQQQDFLTLEKEFDKDSIVIGNPPFNLDTEFINKSLQIAPAVAFILPATWIGSYAKHKSVDSNAALIYSENLGIETYDDANKQKKVKSVLQIWAKPSLDSRYDIDENLRITKPNPRSNPDFQTRVLNGSQQTFENAKLSIVGEQLKFAVRMKGNYPDYNQQIVEKFEDLDPNGEYLLVYSPRPEVIERIKKIDFEQLAQNGSSIFKGFTLYDFINAYEVTEPVLKEVEMSTQKDSLGNTLSVAQVEFFKDSKAKDAKGNLVVLYHGSVETDIETFDPDLGGLRQQTYEKFAFFTNEFKTAKQFSAVVNPTVSRYVNVASGKFGKVYSTYVNLVNPLDMRNMSEQDIQFIAESYATNFGYSVEEAIKRTRSDQNSHQFLKISFNAQQLRNAGYDGFIAEMYPGTEIYEFAVLDSEQVKSINNQEPKKTNNIYDGFPAAQRTEAFTETEKAKIGKIFGDNFVAEYFEKTKKGNYIIRSSYMRDASGTSNSVTLKYDKNREKTFTADEYAINIQKHKSKAIDFVFNDKFQPYRLDELSSDEKFYYNLLKSFNINFVAGNANYDSKGSQQTLGFSTWDDQSDVVFINLKLVNRDPKMIFELLVHEHTHVLFKQNAESLVDVIQVMYDMFFETNKKGQIVATTLFKELMDNAFPGYDSKTWVKKYFNKMYAYSTLAGIKTLDDIGVLFDKVLKGTVDLQDKSVFNTERRATDELLAQLSGVIFSSNAFVKNFMNVSLTNSSKTVLTNFFDSLLNKYASNKLFTTTFKQVFKSFAQARKAHQNKINKMFPNQKITAKDVNDFINTFTEGKYKNITQLLAKLVDEKSNGKRGEANLIIKQVLFLAKKLQGSVVQGLNAYQELEQFMQRNLELIEKMLDNPNEASYLTAEQSLKIARALNRKYGKPISKYLEDYANQKYLDPGFVNPADSETWIDTLFTDVTLFAFNYLELDSDLLNIFNIIDEQRLQKLIGGRAQGTAQGYFYSYDQYKQVYDAYKQNLVNRDQFLVSTRDFLRDTQLILEEFKNFEKLSPKNPGYKDIKIFAEIAKAAEKIVSNDIKEFRIAYEKAVRRIKTYIDANARQAVSQYNPELTEALDYAGQILDLLKTPNIPVQKLQDGILKAVDGLRRLLEVTDRVHERFAEIEDIRTAGSIVDVTYNVGQLVIDMFYKVYGFLEAAFPDLKGQESSLITKYFPSKDTAGKTIEDLGFGKYLKGNKDVIYRQFSKEFVKIIKMFETKYTTVYNDNLTHQEYADIVVASVEGMSPEQVESLESVLKDPKYNSSTINSIQTPQDFLRKYAVLFADRGVKFFERFFELYKQTQQRKQDVLMDFYKDRINFLEQNEGIDAFEVEEVQLPQGIAYNLGNVEYKKILDKVDEDLKTDKETLKSFQQELKKLAEEIKGYNQDKRNAVTQNTKAYYARKIADAKDKQNNIKKQVDDLKNRPKRPQRIKEAVYEYVKKNKVELPKVTRGELVALYNSIKREAAMHDEVDVFGQESIINATAHFEIGNIFKIFDSVTAETDYKKAKSDAEKNAYVVLLPRPKMLELIEQELIKDSRYQTLMDFTRNQFDKSYLYYNEIYKAKFGVDLPSEVLYMPFRTLDSNFLRNFDLRLKANTNVASNDSATLETTIGANTPLAIQNISSVVNGVITATANYSFERLITDFQNLLVLKVGNTTLQNLLSEHEQGRFLEYFQKMMTRVLGYDFGDETELDKVINKFANTFYGTKLALSQLTFIKQFISYFTISFKNKVELTKFFVYLNKEFYSKSENRRWLEENNSNYFFRTIFQGIPGLSETITGDTLVSRSNNFINKFSEKASFIANIPNGWADSSVIVAAFSYYVDQVASENPTMSPEEVRQKANKLLEEVLLYGVANTDPGYRAEFSTRRQWYNRLFNRFSSENIMQISGMITELALKKGGAENASGRTVAAFFASSFLASIVNALFQAWRGFTDEEDVLFDLAFNEFLIGNVLGAVPYLGVIFNAMGYNFDTERFGFEWDIQIPGIEESINIIQRSLDLGYDLLEGRDSTKAFIKFFEGVAPLFSIPGSNITKLVESSLRIANLFGNDWIYKFEEMYYSRTATQQLNKALKNGDTQKAENYINMKIANAAVKNEIIRLSLNVEDAKLSLYDTNTFRAKDPVTGKFVEHNIPERTNEKYKLLTQRALTRLIRTSGYKRLDDEDRLKAIQRVINYYYNFMKNEILVEVYKSLDAKVKREIDYTSMRRKRILSVDEVIANAVRKY